MNIPLCVKQLRAAANALENLLQMNETGVNAAAILSSPTKRGPYKKRKKLHWTQRPENKKLVKRTMKKLQNVRLKGANNGKS